uniref:Uncharacterized protein n=1 Tax=Cacopsylla melanoneura TaxID=428564 RepID=A0A8D8YE85_9HEMI
MSRSPQKHNLIICQRPVPVSNRQHFPVMMMNTAIRKTPGRLVVRVECIWTAAFSVFDFSRSNRPCGIRCGTIILRNCLYLSTQWTQTKVLTSQMLTMLLFVKRKIISR